MQRLDLGVRAFLARDGDGQAFGGIRCMPYASEADAQADARRLAQGMRLKLAAVDIPASGAKTVIMAEPDMDRRAVYEALAAQVERMEGAYVCGPDVGTSEADLDVMRKRTRWVNPAGNDPGGCTALGVVSAIQGVIEPAGHTFVVQGLGSVGLAVARRLLALQARVLGCDPDEATCRRAQAVGVDIIDVQRAMTTPCDVFVPCALGGVLTDATARALPARAVCGSANNQLAQRSVADVLHKRGITYVPDFMANAGAVIEGYYTITQGATDHARATARRHIEANRQRVAALVSAASAGTTPLALAETRLTQ